MVRLLSYFSALFPLNESCIFGPIRGRNENANVLVRYVSQNSCGKVGGKLNYDEEYSGLVSSARKDVLDQVFSPDKAD